MKIETLHRRPVSHVPKIGHASILALAGILVYSALSLGAGNIFDDEWAPPKPVGQPHATPAQPPLAVPATQPATLPRLPIPGKADQAHSRALLKELYAKQITDRSLAGRKKLARTLLDEAPKLTDSPTDRFVLLIGAMDAAREAENLELCFQAADVIAEQYDVDGLSVKADAVLKINLRGDSPAAQTDNVKAALDLIDPLLTVDDPQTAAKVLALARPAAAHDRSLVSAVQDHARAIEAARAAHDRLAPLFEKLKTTPDDPAANLAVGSFFCFSRGDWPRGLPMLARGSDATLKQLASLELSHPGKVEDVTHLADGWWDASGKESGASRSQIRQHAALFYKSILENVSGLRRALLERRIADAAAEPTTVQGKPKRGGRLPGVFGMYKASGGIAPYVALFVPDGKNVMSDQVKAIFAAAKPPVQAGGYIGLAHFELPRDGKYTITAGRAVFVQADGIKLELHNYGNKHGEVFDLKRGVHQLKMDVDNNGGQLAETLISITDEKGKQIPLYILPGEIDPLVRENFKNVKPSELPGRASEMLR
jgi:hypothetical protein